MKNFYLSASQGKTATTRVEHAQDILLKNSKVGLLKPLKLRGLKVNNSIIISDEAANMIESHINSLMEVSISGADKLFLEISKSIQSLGDFPERNLWLNAPIIPAYTYRKMIDNKLCLIIYQIIENTVFIDYIIDCRQEYHWLIE